MLKDRLVALRLEHNKTQEQMAKILGVHRGTYGNYESGKRNPDYDTLIKISEYFDVTTDYLLKGDDYKGIAKEVLKDPETSIAASDGEITEEEAIRALEFILKREKNRRPGDKQ